MTLLCFLLDLPNLLPQLLTDLKQSLLQLANLYAISPRCNKKGSENLEDRIGICYLQRNTSSCLSELNFAYIPRGNLILRDLHLAVNSLPSDGFFLGSTDVTAQNSGNLDIAFSRLLSAEGLYSWGGNDILRKLIFISSCLPYYSMRVQEILKDAEEHFTSIEFMLLEQEIQLGEMPNGDVEFEKDISNLENCVLRRYFSVNSWVLYGFVKKWLQEVKDDGEDSHQAVLVFKNHLVGSTNQLYCNLFASTNQVIDGLDTCQACRCHGMLVHTSKERAGSFICQVTEKELGASDLIENAVMIGNSTVLVLPSLGSYQSPIANSSLTTINVIERTSLASLSEGIMFGNSYVMTPSSQTMDADSDELVESELNVQLFHGLSQVLHALDQGLICMSYCNIEMMKETIFPCFYIVQPSDKGPMLLRRLAGFEEIMSFPDILGSTISVPTSLQASIQASLLQMEAKDYNPLLHMRGLHSCLNSIVRDSLHLRAQENEQLMQSQGKELGVLQFSEMNKDIIDSISAEDWQQLMECKGQDDFSPLILKKKLGIAIQSLDEKQSDPKTLSILERLEAPKQNRPSQQNHNFTRKTLDRNIHVSVKKPLFLGPGLSQPIKPTFQKLKRKIR